MGSTALMCLLIVEYALVAFILFLRGELRQGALLDWRNYHYDSDTADVSKEVCYVAGD